MVALKAQSNQQLAAWRVAARRLGIAFETYRAARESGQKWCYSCAQFRPIGEYRGNCTKLDGLRDECNFCHQASKRGVRGMRIFSVKEAIR